MSRGQNNRKNEELEKIDLMYFFHMLWKTAVRNWLVVICIILVCAVGSFLWARFTYKPMYQAYTSYVVGTGNAYASSFMDSETADQLNKTFSYIAESGVLRDVVALDLGVDYVSSDIQGSVMTDTNFFTITVTDSTPEDAYKVLRSVAKNYPNVADYIIGTTTLTAMDDSGIPSKPVNEGEILDKTEKGIMMGIILSVALVVFQSIRCRTIQRGEELRKITNAYFMGNVPAVPVKKRSNKERQSVKIDNPRITDAFKESIRVLRSRVERKMNENEGKVLLVTSSIPGEGKSTIAANLSLALANKGYKVVLVDGDLRHPSVAKALGIRTEKPGIVQFLKEGGSVSRIVENYQNTKLKVLPGVPSKNIGNPIALIRSKNMKVLINGLRDISDYVIIDTPPCALLSDTVAYADLADELLLVVRYDYTEQKQIRKAVENIADADIPVVGYVLNYTAQNNGMYGYYGGYGYGYGYRYGYGNRNRKKEKDK